MSIQLHHTGRRAGSTGRVRSAYRPMSEINVTPFVDVMLVLLIVFMVTAPLLTVGINVDLPQTKAPSLQEQVEPLVVSIDADGKIYIQKTEVPSDQLIGKLIDITAYNPDTRVFVRGDKSIAYGEVLVVMGRIRTAGFTKVALVAKLPTGAPPLRDEAKGVSQ